MFDRDRSARRSAEPVLEPTYESPDGGFCVRELRRRTIRAAALGITLGAVVSPVTSAVAGTKATPPAQTAASPKWQVFDVPVQGSVSLLSVTATGRDDAWAGGLLVNPRRPPSSPQTPGFRRLAEDPSDDTCNFAKGMFTSVMLHWDGRSWQPTPVPQVARINFLSASSPKDAWASSDCGLLHWDGQKWTSIPYAPVPVQQVSTGAIKAVSAKEAWLAGSTYDNTTQAMGGFVQRWDGRRWRNVPLPDLGDDFSLDGIDARGPRDVWAVGTDYTGNDAHPERLLLLHWNGRTWKRLPEPATAESTQRLTRVRMVTGNDVWVSGWSKTTPGGEAIRHPLLLHWNGRKWAGAKVPDERGELMDVAVSGGQALAVGDTVTPSEPDYTMYALRQAAHGWRTESVPVAGRASLTGLAPIPGGGMWSVGATGDDPDMGPVIARWN
ncbi:hypothetical protein [Actinoallomurus acaciae]|uniref:Secreted protein n=1 Tax=Actinoallomurus acaciae TaxID=502577 RepID=A0ABV5YI60_9ACTN